MERLRKRIGLYRSRQKEACKYYNSDFIKNNIEQQKQRTIELLQVIQLKKQKKVMSERYDETLITDNENTFVNYSEEDHKRSCINKKASQVIGNDLVINDNFIQDLLSLVSEKELDNPNNFVNMSQPKGTLLESNHLDNTGSFHETFQQDIGVFSTINDSDQLINTPYMTSHLAPNVEFCHYNEYEYLFKYQ